MSNKSLNLIEKIIPFVVFGIAIAISIALFFLLFYVVAWGIVIGLVVYAVSFIRQAWRARKGQATVETEREGRIIEHDEIS